MKQGTNVGPEMPDDAKNTNHLDASHSTLDQYNFNNIISEADEVTLNSKTDVEDNSNFNNKESTDADGRKGSKGI